MYSYKFRIAIFVFLQDLTSFYPYYLCEHIKPRTKVVLKNQDHLKIKIKLFQLFHFIATFNATAILGKLIFGKYVQLYMIYNICNGSFLFYFAFLQ